VSFAVDGQGSPANALAAPVKTGMMLLPHAPRPPRQSFREGPSTVFWVAVGAFCTVVLQGPSLHAEVVMQHLASAPAVGGAEALETISSPA